MPTVEQRVDVVPVVNHVTEQVERINHVIDHVERVDHVTKVYPIDVPVIHQYVRQTLVTVLACNNPIFCC